MFLNNTNYFFFQKARLSKPLQYELRPLSKTENHPDEPKWTSCDNLLYHLTIRYAKLTQY